jgi:hypothetical protein
MNRGDAVETAGKRQAASAFKAIQQRPRVNVLMKVGLHGRQHTTVNQLSL